MGRKSKKKKGRGASRQTSDNEKDTSARAPKSPGAPGPSCWICLDDEGPPLMRECACRGDSAGFAHLSCLIQYAETKCVSDDDNSDDPYDLGWMRPFAVCPNCNQKYRGELAIDLATACVDSADKKGVEGTQFGPHCQLKALQYKLATVIRHRRYSIAKVEECKEVAKKCDAFIEENTALWSMLPDEYARVAETTHLVLMGNLYLGGKDATCGRKALEYYEQAKRIDPQSSSHTNAKIAKAKALCEGRDKEEFDFAERAKGKEVEGVRLNYEQSVKRYGEESEEAIGRGKRLVVTLKAGLRIVESERLADKLATLSRRILGPDHPHTNGLDVILRHVKDRLVFVDRGNGLEAFHALRYNRNGKKCVVQGPLQDPRNVGKEKTFEVNAYPVIPSLLTPVICHGLKSAAHLNGRVGDIRSDNQGPGKDRFLVHLEGKKEPVLVKLENLRIAFDLPEPTTAGDS